MLKPKFGTLLILLFVLTGCGPDTIFLRPSLDTPERHIANGQALLEQGKYYHALREFKRADELAPDNLDALIGLGIAQGYCETYERGMLTLQKAQDLAATPDEQRKIEQAFATLENIQSNPK